MSDFGTDTSSDEPVRAIPFSDEDHRKISQLSLFMQVAGVISLIASVLGAVTTVLKGASGSEAVINLAGSVIGVLVSAVLGACLLIAGNAFKAVVHTDGQDQVHLANGLAKLRTYFMVRGLVIIAIVLFACLGGLFMASMGPRY